VSKGHYRHELAISFDCQASDIPVDQTPPTPVEPRRPPHEAGCWCVRCHNAGLQYADYLQQKRMNEL